VLRESSVIVYARQSSTPTGVKLVEHERIRRGYAMNRLSLQTATTIVEAATAKAVEIGQPMNIAVVDDGGHLVAFARMDGAIKASIDISIRKARTSIMMNLPTSALMDVSQPGAELYGLEQLSGGLVLFGGGLLLEVDGEVVGAIGVSAGSVEQDVTVAQAGVAAL
jgi:uncharacterized protein GlcG (DUF336 family)